MVHPWVTTMVIAFGILVAIIGVIAYLRMYKNSAWSPAGGKQAANRPAQAVPPEEEAVSAAKNDKM
ncbi:hypothetical protein [Paenibacillus methanolicus]|uniref:Uncharacterized protein n=1 Tax=Paenibacillus methanolicus TaxID=582686 RepID=A0A5S5BX14_9BACL|nr:hypothetical protein [Paenibacillus methanolicus]TYP70680.1 hypothetical protein BCM02_111186 [Paenibacillus methanolicus]